MRLSAAFAILFTFAASAQYSGMGYLENDAIRIGVNLDIGGAITYLSPVEKEENMINSHDWGRQIQMSFYSGPNPFEPEGSEVRENWRFLGWNPIQSGDCYGNESKVLDYKNDGTSIYVKCRPMHWPMNNYPGECTFETWIELEGNTAKVRSKLNNDRPDKTQYPPRSQELPAVYTNGNYYRLFTYDGVRPFTGEAPRRITKVWDTSKGVNVEGGPWDHWYATENWAALVRDDDFGMGVWSPQSFSYVGGFAGTPGEGGPKDGPTGYFAPTRREILDHNIEYEYEYVIIVGQLDEIRDYVYEHGAKNTLPATDFKNGRDSWVLRGCTDDGLPIKDRWKINLGSGDARIIGPDEFWIADEDHALVLRAAFDTGANTVQVQWEGRGEDGQRTQGNAPLEIISDGEMRNYRLNLGALEGYSGACTRLALAPAIGDHDSPSVTIDLIAIPTN